MLDAMYTEQKTLSRTEDYLLRDNEQRQSDVLKIKESIEKRIKIRREFLKSNFLSVNFFSNFIKKHIDFIEIPCFIYILFLIVVFLGISGYLLGEEWVVRIIFCSLLSCIIFALIFT